MGCDMHDHLMWVFEDDADFTDAIHGKHVVALLEAAEHSAREGGRPVGIAAEVSAA